MKLGHFRRQTGRLLVSSFSLSAMLFVQQAAAFTIAQTPPFLPTPLAPNIVLTFDDSGSMTSAFVPEDICSIEDSTTTRGARRTKSSTFNSMYYDPTVRYEPPSRYDAGSRSYVPYTTSFNAARINGLVTSSATVDLEKNYRVTWYYEPNGVSLTDLGGNEVNCSTLKSSLARNNTADFPGMETSGVRAYYYVYNADQCSSKDVKDDACYRLVRVGVDAAGGGVVTPAFTDERQNFANWYSFYRTRNLMTASAAMRALTAVPATTRVGWQSINPSCGSPGVSSGTKNGSLFDDNCTDWDGNRFDKRLKIFDDQHRANLYSWLSRMPASQTTPLRQAAARAGDYFRTDGIDSPYAEEPTKRLGTEFSCRPNFHVLMTDGIWNETGETFCFGAQCNNADKPSADLRLPDGATYSRTAPVTAIFRDDWTNSLADVSFYYWSRDLRPDLANNLQPYVIDRSGNLEQQYWNPKNDPATWQHMTTFTVGLGLARSFTAPGIPWAGSTYAGEGYRALLSGAKTWPKTGRNELPGNVYDLWHAAINSRGQSFSADTPVALSDALATALNRILERESAAAALATNSTRLAAETLLYQARFFSGTWTGALTAYALNSDGSVGNPQWEASAPGKIPAHSARNIFTWGGTAGAPFTQAGLTASGQWDLIGSTALLDYLRGDKSNETPRGLNYRSRGGPLGDIVNSDPAYVATENLGYSALAPEGSSYSAFLAAKKSRKKMLYVGSNDGFLHGFEAMTGQEVFAYVPSAVIADLRLLAAPEYTHRFYVDGSPVAYDAFLGGRWKTVLIGSTGAGGRSVFALDVTDPSSFTASNVLWEINQNTSYRSGTDAADPQYGARLGYTIGQAVVAKLNNGEWAAIFGNGYRSPGNSGAGIPGEQASLYIVRMSDGALIKRIDTGIGSLAEPNGLGTPTLYDTNGDNVYDVVYASDMRGNVWKFNLSGNNESAWGIAFAPATGFSNGAPLFQARNASNVVQPISARIELASPPAGKSGIMVLFGTGRFFAVGDNTDSTAQTFYGIWDDNVSAVSGRGSLQVQTVSTVSIDLRGVTTDVREVTSNPIDWTSKRGWFIDLPTRGERVIGGAVVRDNRVIFTTLVPSPDPCVFGGSGWLMEVSAATGAKLPYAVFDTSGDKLITTADRDISGVPIGVGMVKRPLVIEGTPTAAKFLSGSKGEIQVERNRTFGKPLGRESWREIQR